MKVRISEQSIRLRLAPAEVDRLREQGRGEQRTRIGSGESLAVVLEIGGAVPRVEAKDGWRVLTIGIPAATAGPWLEGSAPGVSMEIETGGGTLTVVAETDLRP